MKLDPGKYAVVCFIPANSDGKPHAAHGMFGSRGRSRDRRVRRHRAGAAASTITLGDFSFTLPAGFTGKGTSTSRTRATQVHEAVLYKLGPGKTVADAKKFLLTPPGTPPPAGPPPFTRRSVASSVCRRSSTRG